MNKYLIGGATAVLTAGALTFVAPAPQAEAMWCPGAVASGVVHVPIFVSVLVIEWCDWAPPVAGVDSHKHCEYGGFWGYGGKCDWRNGANVIVPPPPGHI